MPERIGHGKRAELPPSPTESDFGHGPQIWDAIVRGHGSVKAAAFTMGQKDASQIRRQVTTGTIPLREFMEADETALCEFADYVLETFQPARKSKQQLALETLPEMMRVIIEALTELRGDRR